MEEILLTIYFREIFKTFSPIIFHCKKSQVKRVSTEIAYSVNYCIKRNAKPLCANSMYLS